MFTSKVLALENAQVSRYFTFLTLHLPTMQTHLQQQVFNPCSRIQVVTFARVVTNTVEDQTLDAIPAQCSGGEVPKSSLPLPSCTGATASGSARTGTRYRQKQAWPDWQVRGTLDQLNCFDIQHIYHILQVWELGQDVWISCPCKKKLGLTPPKINCSYYQECLLFNVQWCFCSAVTCTLVQKGVPEQIQQKCSQYFSLYLIGISLISGSSKSLVAVFTKLL